MAGGVGRERESHDGLWARPDKQRLVHERNRELSPTTIRSATEARLVFRPKRSHPSNDRDRQNTETPRNIVENLQIRVYLLFAQWPLSPPPQRNKHQSGFRCLPLPRASLLRTTAGEPPSSYRFTSSALCRNTNGWCYPAWALICATRTFFPCASQAAHPPEASKPGVLTGDTFLELNRGIIHATNRYASNTLRTTAYSSGLCMSAFTSHQ